MSIHDLALRGAEIMQQLVAHGEDDALRADLNRIAADIESSWTKADIETLEVLPPYYLNVSLVPLGGYVRLWVRDTDSTIAISPGFGHRLIHYVYEKEKR